MALSRPRVFAESQTKKTLGKGFAESEKRKTPAKEKTLVKVAPLPRAY
jgi:hypothetical protein